MTPVHCRVKHDPESGTYGDCTRACVATILDKQPEEVPHFAHDNPDADTCNQRIADYLATQGLAPWWTHYDGDLPLGEVLSALAENGPGASFMLFGETANGGSHVVVCRDGAVVHDPAWYRVPLVRGGSHGAWSVLVFVRL